MWAGRIESLTVGRVGGGCEVGMNALRSIPKQMLIYSAVTERNAHF